MIWKAKQPISFYEMYIPSLRLERVTKRTAVDKIPPHHFMFCINVDIFVKVGQQ